MRRRPEMQSESECRVDAIIFVGCSRRLPSVGASTPRPLMIIVPFPSEPLIFPRHRRRHRYREYSRRRCARIRCTRGERECNYLTISKGAAAIILRRRFSRDRFSDISVYLSISNPAQLTKRELKSRKYRPIRTDLSRKSR